MGHDEHFLERLDRVAREQTELALELYRDHQAVRHLLDREDVPVDAARVAIALSDGKNGPYVIVARNGHFVTCLGEGMSPRPWSVLPRSALMGSLGFASDMRRRKQLAKQISREGEDAGDLVARLSKRKNRISREEIVGISAFAPLFAHDLYMLSAKRCADVVQAGFLSHHGARRAEAIEHHARQVWAAAYGVELCGTVEERVARPVVAALPDDFSFSMATSHLCDFTFVLRGIWAAGRIGPMLVRSYFNRFDRARSAMKALDAVLALTTIALRHEGARAEIVRDLERRAEVSPERPFANVFEYFVRVALDCISNPSALEQPARALGAVLYRQLAQGKLAPGAYGYAESDEHVPADLAETAYLNAGGALEADPEGAFVHLFAAVPLLAKAPVEAFHYPSALVSSLVDPWGEEEVRAHHEQLRAARGVRAPMKYDAKIERNAPCPCGSGKKFKKCCAP